MPLENLWRYLNGPQDDDGQPTLAPPAMHMLSDAAIESAAQDLLGFKPFAEALFGLIDHPETKTPLTLAINGPWGSGKSSLAHMVEELLRRKPPGRRERRHLTYWFNAWLHDDTDNLGTAFMADIIRACDRQRSWWRRRVFPLPLALCDAEGRRRRMMGWVATFLFLAVGIAVAVAQNPEATYAGYMQKFAAALAKPAETPAFFSIWIGLFMVTVIGLRYFTETAKSLSAYINSAGRGLTASTVARARDQLRDMIEEVVEGDARFVVFIDDLERCRPKSVLKVLEVVNQLLPFEPVVTVIIADMPAVAACVEHEYEDLAERYNPAKGTAHSSTAKGATEEETAKETAEAAFSYGRLFLEKFVQLQFDLPTFENTGSAGFADHLFEEEEETKRARPIRDALAAVYLPDTVTHRSFAAATRPIREAAFWPSLLPLLVAWIGWPVWWLSRQTLNSHHRDKLQSVWAQKLMLVMYLLFFSMFILVILFPFFQETTVYTFSSPLFVVRFEGYYLGTLIFFIFLLLAYGVFYYSIMTMVIRREIFSEPLRYASVRRKLDKAHDSGEDEVEKVIADEKTLDPQMMDIIRVERRIRQLDDKKSGLFATARTAALSNLSVHPRNVKRILNRTRLSLYVAHMRGLLDSGEFSAEHIGQWVAFQEQWPEVAQRCRQDGTVLEDPFDDVPEDARTFLKAHPKLSDLARRLVHLDGVGSPEKGPEMATEDMAGAETETAA